MPRANDETMQRAMLLPFAKEILEGKNKGIVHEVRVDEAKKLVYYEIIGRANIKGKEATISVIVSKFKPDAKKYISVIKKALRFAGLNVPLSRQDTSRLRDTLHTTTFHATNNTIPHISAESKQYPNITLDIQGITEDNKLEKFCKAVRLTAKQLRLPVGIEQDEKAGEKHLYPIKQELCDVWTSMYDELLRALYIAITDILDLPAVSVETMKKSLLVSALEKSLVSKLVQNIKNSVQKIFSNFKLRYRGKIIYNPETGEPIKKKDFDRLIRAIDGVMNMNTKDAAKQMTLDSVTIGKLLKRLASCQTTDTLEKLKLDELKYKGKSFDWIRKDYANLASTLGIPLSRAETARYQVCEDYAAQLITRVNDDVRNDIKSVLLWGIQNKKSRPEVSQELFNKFAAQNRSWKRIVDTETVNTANLASILEEVNQAADGGKVYFKRYEMAGACPFCAKVDGVIALWSDTPLADDKIKDPYASVAIWEGKEPGKNVLVPGALHPHCRGGWTRWGADEFNASSAKLNGKEKEWNAAVGKVSEEYNKKGIENPHDGTNGFVKRVNEVYRKNA